MYRLYIMADNDYDVLVQKFDNFKKFMKEISKGDKVKVFETWSNEDYLKYSSFLLLKENELDQFTDHTCKELEIDSEHKDKIKRYFNCFVDYIKATQK